MLKREYTPVLIFAALLWPLLGITQVNAGRDTVFCGTPVTLNAVVTPHPSTTSYTGAVIPYAPQNFTGGTSVPLTDDGYTNPLPIGFQFSFFGQQYTQFHISANGWMSFVAADIFAQVNNNPSAFPSASTNMPKAAIAIWQDWNPALGGNINYYTAGTAPNRILVVNWNNVPHYQCNSEFLKAQILLYEGSNIIEYHVANKGSCPAWQTGKATQGLHNQSGTAAFTVPGRNAAVFALTDDAYRFTPSGPPESTTVTWYDLNAGGVNVGTGTSFSASPANTTLYKVQVQYCCSPGLFTDTVQVTVDKTTLTMTSNKVSCFGGSDGSALVSVSGSVPPYSYSWSTIPPDTDSLLNAVPKGTYYVSVYHGGCVFNDSVVILEPSEIFVQTLTTDESCGDTNGVAYAVATGGQAAYTYSWSTGVSDDSLLNVTAGTYTVTVIDGNGCSKTGTAVIGQVNNVNASFTPSVISGPAPLTVQFTNSSTGAESYQWDLGNGQTSSATDASATYTEEGSYLVTLTAIHGSVCMDAESVTIIVTKDSVPETVEVSIPNVLVLTSSNEANREFKLRAANIDEFSMVIYNRWGIEVFRSNDVSSGWNGGEEPAGTYYYVITYREKNKESVTVKSFLTLFR